MTSIPSPLSLTHILAGQYISVDIESFLFLQEVILRGLNWLEEALKLQE